MIAVTFAKRVSKDGIPFPTPFKNLRRGPRAEKLRDVLNDLSPLAVQLHIASTKMRRDRSEDLSLSFGMLAGSGEMGATNDSSHIRE